MLCVNARSFEALGATIAIRNSAGASLVVEGAVDEGVVEVGAAVVVVPPPEPPSDPQAPANRPRVATRTGTTLLKCLMLLFTVLLMVLPSSRD
jgi:hypothetical protein